MFKHLQGVATPVGLHARSPFECRPGASVARGIDPSGGDKLVVSFEDWPVDSAYSPMLLDTISDLCDVGAKGRFVPLILEHASGGEPQKQYSFGRVIATTGRSVRVRRFKGLGDSETQLGFIDEDGYETITANRPDARTVYRNTLDCISSNPENSLKSGLLVLKNDGESRRFRDAANRLASAGLVGELTFVEDMSDFDSATYRREHVLVLLRTLGGGNGVMYREDFVDGAMVRRTFMTSGDQVSFDDHHCCEITAGLATEREMYRQIVARITNKV